MDGIELASRYAAPPNSLGYCGPRTYREDLLSKDPERIRESLTKFHAHYSYLNLIADFHGRDPFDLEVVRAFWTGNDLLEIPADVLSEFITKKLMPGNPRAEKLSHVPEGLVPHHTFNVFYIKFVSDSVPRTAETFDKCMVSFGKYIGKNRISRFSLNENFRLVEKVEEIQSPMELEPGDLVSCHWGAVIERLSPSDYGMLEKYTRRNLEVLKDLPLP